jgi:hypothetical protein
MLALAAGLSWSPAQQARADADPIDPAIVQEVREAIAQLDAEDFGTRSKAAERLGRRVEDPRLASFLAGQFARALLSSDSSFEVRAQLEALSKQLQPASPVAGEARSKAADIAPLLDQLNGNSSRERDSAQRRLKSMLSEVELIGPLFVELKRRAADRGLTAQSRRVLEPLLDQAREAWLGADPARVPLGDVPAEQIARWVDDLTRLDESEAADRFRREMAERELLDAIARDDTRPGVLAIIAQKIAEAPDAATTTTLQNIADFAKPALAAEVWRSRMNGTVQYLLVDVPQFNETAPRPTHFDRSDENTAHCVSGSSLTEGDYPVQIAIPHPVPGQDVMFHLTNLPTPRRRLLYEYHVKRDETLRLREISQRTVDDFLAKQRVLDETQILLLAQLDPQIVSRFVGRYFQAVPNQPLLSTTSELLRLPTVHAGICYVMTRIGTREAAPALEQLARSGRLGKSTIENPYQIAWIAALAIAQRDPWPEVDPWLAGLIDQNTPLVTHIDPKPALGPTAAALLLDRHGASTQSFGLDSAPQVDIGQCRFVGYRFASEKDRQDVQQWWERLRKASEGRSAP